MYWEEYWQYYVDYIESIYRKPEEIGGWFEERKEKKDLTFSAKDIIRFYNCNLEMDEKEEVKDFFAEIMTHVVEEIQNSRIWLCEEMAGKEPPDVSVQSLKYLNNYDLIIETTKYFYKLLDAIRDIGTMPFDVYAYTRLYFLYKEGVILVNNWMKYYDRLVNWKFDVLPWWKYDEFYGNIDYG